eukprot:8966612-Pyramimonas_sp.AAC.1
MGLLARVLLQGRMARYECLVSLIVLSARRTRPWCLAAVSVSSRRGAWGSGLRHCVGAEWHA